MLLHRLALCVALFSPLAAVAAQSAKPNIVYILADDLGWADVGFHGPDIKTPNIDKLAAAGAKLEAFYVQPVCSPTRAGLMTGRYPIRHGLQTGVVRPWAQYGLPLEERTLPQALREVGYETAICGKWHLGHFQPSYLPMQRGFDRQYGHYNGALDYYTHDRDGGLDWHRDQKAAREEGYTTHLIARECIRLIEQKDARKPLFLYVPFNAVHAPYQEPPGKYSASYASLKGTRRTYAGMLAAMDEAIGQIVAAIEKKGLRSNTLFIFSSDNGGPSPGAITSNGPLRGAKGTLYEGGVRVPAFATWDGHIPAGAVVNAPLHIVDWYPTLLKLAGASLEQKLPLDGRDAWPAVTQGRLSPHDAILLNTTPRNGAIRMGDWKLVLNGKLSEVEGPADEAAGGTTKAGKQGKKAKAAAKDTATAAEELFNLAQDPYEKVNLAAKNPEKLRELRARLDAFAKEAAPPKLAPRAAGFTSPKVWGEF
ncbi:MAG: arylsulfatase [Verrucomicrobia bacterium]|nr:arylsulfatase [Verrucomicrobiota bacterium]